MQWFNWETAICLHFFLLLFLAEWLLTDSGIVWSVWQYFYVLGHRARCLSSLPLTPSSHHLIKEQGRIQCFLITLCLALRPSFNDETSAEGGLDICFIIIILHLISRSSFVMEVCVCVWVRGCLCTHRPFLYFSLFLDLFFFCCFFLSHFALRLKIWCPELECAFSLFSTFGYVSTWIHSDIPLNLSSLLDLWQSQAEGKVRFRAGRTFCKGTKKRLKDKTSLLNGQRRGGREKALEEDLRWTDSKLSQQQMFFALRLYASNFQLRWTEMSKTVCNQKYANRFSSYSQRRRQ